MYINTQCRLNCQQSNIKCLAKQYPLTQLKQQTTLHIRRTQNKQRVFGQITQEKPQTQLVQEQSHSSKLGPPLVEQPQKPFEIDFLKYIPGKSSKPYVVIAGCGPAGLSLADRVSSQGYRVCIIDPKPLSHWPNNYGVWCDEFEALGLQDCFEYRWDKAQVFLNNGPDGQKFLDRPYARVDRYKLKTKLLQKCKQQGVTFYESFVSSMEKEDGKNIVVCQDGEKIPTSIVVDATGHARKLVNFDQKFDPGYQGAYGVTVEVESHPFDVDKMLFMDWRDEFTDSSPEIKERNFKLPTFLYAMPFSKTKIFFEETSLVARPPVSFQDLTERLTKRLEYLNIKVKHVEEEEYCLIPMGGVLPSVPQRVIGIGGTAGMVHPSTGFMVARTLGAVPTLGDAIVEALSKYTDPAERQGDNGYPQNAVLADQMSQEVWGSVWPIERINQREFFNFGMDILLTLNLEQTQKFFQGFFKLKPYYWQGFLSARLNVTELISFGWSLFLLVDPVTKVNLMAKGLPGITSLLYNLALANKDNKSKISE